MSLESGIYHIVSKAEDRYIGRHPVEDRSARPKQVFALPQCIDAPKVRDCSTVTVSQEKSSG